jgi:hypothetical protein
VTLPTNTLVSGDKVESQCQIAANKRYLSKQHILMQGGLKLDISTNFLRIDRLIDDNIITPQTTVATQLDISTADTMVFSDGTVLPLTGSTFNNNGKTSKQTGSFAAYVNTIAYLYGTRPYKTLNKTSSATLVANSHY